MLVDVRHHALDGVWRGLGTLQHWRFLRHAEDLQQKLGHRGIIRQARFGTLVACVLRHTVNARCTQRKRRFIQLIMIPGAARAVQKALLQRQKPLPQLVQHPGGDEQHHPFVVADGVQTRWRDADNGDSR